MSKIILVAISTLLLFACSSTTEEHTAHSATDTAFGQKNSGNMQKPEAATNILDVRTSLSDAIAIYREAYPGAVVHSVNLDKLNEDYIYEVKGVDAAKEYEAIIDLSTKEIIKQTVETEKDTESRIDFSTIIQPGNAIEVASQLKETEKMTPTSWTLKAENKKQRYVVKFEDDQSEVKVIVDAVEAEPLDIKVGD